MQWWSGFECAQLFDQFDVDKSGTINAGEFRLLMENFGIEVTKNELKKAMNNLDTDGGGTISFDEFQIW